MQSSAMLQRVHWGFLTDVSGQHIRPEMSVRNCHTTLHKVVEECRSHAVYSNVPTKYTHIHLLYKQNAEILMSKKLIEYRSI